MCHDALGQFEPTIVSKVNKRIIRDALKNGDKGVAISICDYTREALLFCMQDAIELRGFRDFLRLVAMRITCHVIALSLRQTAQGGLHPIHTDTGYRRVTKSPCIDRR